MEKDARHRFRPQTICAGVNIFARKRRRKRRALNLG
jgi:hypothetical protein